MNDSTELKDSAAPDMAKLWKATGPPDISASEIQYLEKIGGGCFGSVYRGLCRGKEVAVKKLFKQDLDEKALVDFRKEVEIMAQLRHPNVLLFMGACTDPGNMAIVTELLTGGNGEQVLRDPTLALSLYRRLLMALDVAQGMAWLHASKPQIIHRVRLACAALLRTVSHERLSGCAYLKPSNLLVDDQLRVKVCDFGLSTIKENETEKLQDTDSVPGTPLWMAPEVLMGKPFDASSDVYSFGIVLWEMLTKEEVYPEFSSFGAFKQSVPSHGEQRAICYKHHRPTVPPKTPASLVELMERCWHRDPVQRPSFREIIAMLQRVIVDVAVSDAVGNEFWKAQLLTAGHQVSWDKFKEKLVLFHGWPQPEPTADQEAQSRCLRYLLAERKPNAPKDSPPDVVTLEGFGRLLQWFGPMGRKGDWLRALRETVLADWFFGDCDSSAAEKALSKRPKGTFLVRMSASHPGQFTISKMGSSGINHQRITYQPGVGYTLKAVKAGGLSKKTSTAKVVQANCTLPEFILKHAAPVLSLKSECPGSPFEFLRGQKPVHEKGTGASGYVVQDDDSE